VIDVGCGCGTTTIALAEAVGPEGRVLGVDISAPMLAHAGECGAGLAQLDLLQADAGVHEFDPGWADLVVSRFGVMFFAEPVRAFANLRGGMKQDGRMVAAVWQSPKRNPWATFMLRAFPEIELPAAGGDEDKPGPFRMADPDKLRRLMRDAGFGAIELEDLQVEVTPAPSVDEALLSASEVGPFARLLAEVPEQRREAMVERARAYLEEQYREGLPRLAAGVWLIHARP
jgi:ubiquinone/menaquinone biosynthesis C-methylase UbiE